MKLAQKEGYRARAAYKLKEIDEELKLLKPGQLVVDLGAVPGAWSQYVRRKFAPKDAGAGGAASGALNGAIIALDLLDFQPIEGVTFIQGDFREDETFQAVAAAVGTGKVELVLSDLSPNISGIESADQARSVYLGERALEFAREALQPGGDLVVKAFQGAGFSELERQFRACFDKVHMRKPKASRDRSREVFLVAKGLRPSSTGGA